MDEFQLIDRFFRPLARKAKGAFNLENDTAFFLPPKGEVLVLTTDAMVEGVHFLASEDPKTVAQRLLRVNLSDLAASGATPQGYLLNLTGGPVTERWLARFTQGLAADQKRFGLSLYGGDTTSGSKTFCLSISAFGTTPKGNTITRGGAKAGELICVSGTIGDGFLGLQAAKAGRKSKALKRYLLPEPRLSLGRALAGFASASIDISDGLFADVIHILEASHVGARLFLDQVPFSKEGHIFAKGSLQRALLLCGGGDDYELAFTISKQNEKRLSSIAKRLRLPLAVIGETVPGRGLKVFGKDGKPVPITTFGYRHFK